MAQTKRPTFTDLACQAGLVPDTAAGRESYQRWMRRNPQAAQKAALDAASGRRVETSSAGRRVAAGRSAAASGVRASRGDSTAYPDAWRAGAEAHQRTSGIQTANGIRVRATSMTQDPLTPYPTTMLAGHATRARTVEVRGGRPARRDVHAAGETSTYLAAMRRQEQAALEASQARRLVPSNPSDAIMAAGGNAARLEAMRRAELERMEREVWNRG